MTCTALLYLSSKQFAKTQTNIALAGKVVDIAIRQVVIMAI